MLLSLIYFKFCKKGIQKRINDIVLVKSKLSLLWFIGIYVEIMLDIC